jgi:DNA invertase Pin-like site-specific DNA recombinase
MGTPQAAPHQPVTAEPVPVAFLGRTSTLVVQDPAASLRRQLRACQGKLPAGWFIAAHYWDIESGGLDLRDRGHGTAHEQVNVGIPRDGGLAALLAEVASGAPTFAAVVCEDIERSGRDTYNALKLEKRLSDAGIPLFATDEPINVEGANATTVLVRRVKQGVAEWYRLQIKEKAWAGLREHTLDGWNIGAPPYGYLAEKVPHPVPAKRAEGRTKTRLALDPDRAPVVAQIFTWRIQDRLGVTAIRLRLNADTAAYPPPTGESWTDIGVYQMLANPKYTGHMVWNRSSKKGGRRRANPPQEWVWTPAPSHPAIITREVYDQAQQVTATRASMSAVPGAPAHPLARRSYELRSRIRCRLCKRRMHGTTRTAGTYYICPHDVSDPRHAAAVPNHPKTITLREDHAITLIKEFFATRVFGPDRAAMLAENLPANAAAEAAQRHKQAQRLRKHLRRIETAQDSQVRELDEPADPSDPGARAWRARIRQRFTELEAERTQAAGQLAALETPADDAGDASLLDMLPIAPALLDEAPARLRLALYQAFGIELLYNKEANQVTIYATITTSTPHTVAGLIGDSEPPTPRSDSLWPPMAAKNLTADGYPQERRGRARDSGCDFRSSNYYVLRLNNSG